MMEYVTQCIDPKTGHTLVLSEASYNQAMDWLQRKAEKYFKEIYRCENCNGIMEIYVGTPKHSEDYNGQPDVWYINTVMFYYDEERGLLMEE